MHPDVELQPSETRHSIVPYELAYIEYNRGTLFFSFSPFFFLTGNRPVSEIGYPVWGNAHPYKRGEAMEGPWYTNKEMDI